MSRKRTAPNDKTPSWILALLFTLWLMPAYANTPLELSIIPLKHRPAENLMPSLVPFIRAPATLSAAGNQLLLRADKPTSAQLRMLIDELDQPLRQYLIEVRQGIHSGIQTLHIKAGIKEGTIKLGSNGSTTNNTITLRRSTGTKGGASLQSITALEGYPVYIETGKEIPLWSLDEQGRAGQTYKAINTGFYATLLSGNDERFAMQISTKQQDSIGNSKSLKTASSHSTLRGKLGEWTVIGGSQTRDGRSTSSPNRKSSYSNQQQQTLYLRVTERY